MPAMLTLHRQARGPQAGITLIELLVSMIIMVVLSTMMVGGWISLQRSFAFAASSNTARATTRDALDRISSEIRAAQPPTSSSTTPFYFDGAAPYVCGPTSCVFYSAYNNSAYPDGTGRAQLRLTAIWLDTFGTQEQKTLYWQRDTNNSGAFDSGDRKVVLASNVVNTAASVNRPIFTYILRDASGNYTYPTSLTSLNLSTLVSVQVELIVDANLAHTPNHIDLRTTVQPRNESTN
jgi:type II secretory pathway pseudopilin PulG